MTSEHGGILFGTLISATGSLGLSAGRVWIVIVTGCTIASIALRRQRSGRCCAI